MRPIIVLALILITVSFVVFYVQKEASSNREEAAENLRKAKTIATVGIQNAPASLPEDREKILGFKTETIEYDNGTYQISFNLSEKDSSKIDITVISEYNGVKATEVMSVDRELFMSE